VCEIERREEREGRREEREEREKERREKKEREHAYLSYACASLVFFFAHLCSTNWNWKLTMVTMGCKQQHSIVKWAALAHYTEV
jgi:hypothetical protein